MQILFTQREFSNAAAEEKKSKRVLLEYNGIDIYCKISPSDCDVFPQLVENLRFVTANTTFFSDYIKMKQRNRACINLIEVSEGAVERLPEIEIGSLESSLVARLGDCEAFRAGASTYYMSKDKDIAFEVTQGIVNRGLYFKRID